MAVRITEHSRETLLQDDTVANLRVTKHSRETLLQTPNTADAFVTHHSREVLLQLKLPPRVLALGMNTPIKDWVG